MVIESAAQLSNVARQAVTAHNWPIVRSCAERILALDRDSAEGWFLTALASKSAGHTGTSIDAFSRALKLDDSRYDAAIELAELYWRKQRHGEAMDLLQKYQQALSNSPLYLHLAAVTYSRLGLHEQAWPLFQQADKLQPGIDKFRASLAGCATLLGETKIAHTIYRDLLRKHPQHQRHHYELSRLQRATDEAHLKEMKKVLEMTRLPPPKNIFLYYAIGKELEDLGQWEQSFHYYKLGGDAAAGVAKQAGYDVSSDIALIDCIIDVCDVGWLQAESTTRAVPQAAGRTPIFVVGLPRTGTTLTERILASHSKVESADESFFLQIAIKQASKVNSKEAINPAMIKAAATARIGDIADSYLQAIDYRLAGKPYFVDKYPFNFLYLGFIAKAFPNAKIVHLRRNPMDACFAMYKQSFFKFAYTLDDISQYYLAYARLCRHWQLILKDRFIEVEYEMLVAEPETQIRGLLAELGLAYESSCLDFHLNKTASATASSVQVREAAHTRSVNKWLHWQAQLEPLQQKFRQAGIL